MHRHVRVFQQVVYVIPVERVYRYTDARADKRILVADRERL